ncbi:MAG: SDR family oxidoreductase [Actinomycetia bacterium]|nr:SDR family oxidoreductase [Actinomycetes bacterium]MCP4961339.1 SDR family oxidoreductase [Actinomycetes bacterium]
MLSSLTGQHAFITGGGSGIGLGAARAFVQDGAQVTLCGRSVDKLEAACEELGQAARSVVTDVGDEDALASAMDDANDRAPLSIVVANAGTGGAGPFLRTDLDEWQRVLHTNLTGVFLTFKHGGRHLATSGGGAMCAVSSIAGSHTHRFMAAYVTSKAGLNMLVRNTADELGSLGVRVNAVAPGLVETELSIGLQNNVDVNEDYRHNMPLGRRGTPADTGAAIRFLCGPESSWITGVVLPVDGGHHLRRGPNIDPLLEPFVDDLPPISGTQYGSP